MQNITTYVAFVKQQAEFHESKAKALEKSGDKRRVERHLASAKTFREIEQFLGSVPELIDTARSSSQDDVKRTPPSRLSLTFEEVKDLPEEMIQELAVSDGDRLDYSLQAIIDEEGGVLSLDRILFTLFKRTGVVHKRQNINTRLYRMAGRGELHSVPGRKGVYSSRPLTLEEVEALR